VVDCCESVVSDRVLSMCAMVQANLGLRRLQQCEDFLTLAAWLALKEPSAISAAMHCQLARLYGQLYSTQGKLEMAVKVRGRRAALGWWPLATDCAICLSQWLV
jgi:hypothetical protein